VHIENRQALILRLSCISVAFSSCNKTVGNSTWGWRRPHNSAESFRTSSNSNLENALYY
jgi:hypothetical protein